MRWIDSRGGLFAAAIAAAVLAATPAAAASAAEQALAEAATTIGAGEFSWNEDGAPSGPVRVVITVSQQRMLVYRGATLIAVAAVSTGSAGHDTPIGEFTVLQKAVTHHSSKYDDASMPYMQRLTWDGVAIHAGRDPGFAASHGCVRVPLGFARKLYSATRLGAHVSVTDDMVLPGVPEAPLTAPAAPSDEADVEATRQANLAAR